MTTLTLLTSEAKEALRKSIRGLRTVLLDELARAAKGAYQLDVTAEKAKLAAPQRARRKRLEAWIAEQVRAAMPEPEVPDAKPTKGAKARKAKSVGASKGTPSDAALRDRFFGQAVAEAAHTLLNRLVLVRILEHHGLFARGAPPVVTGAFKSAGYAGEFLGYAGPLADDDTLGYRHLLDTVFAELALELPGLFGSVGLTSLFPVPASTLRAVLDVLNDPVLAPAWGDDTTLGWIYQYWNDPEREALDAKITAGGKIEPHEIASKTQMFTERYMVEWLLQNSLGFTWLCLCRKNGWTPDADRVLPDLDARRAAWRARRDAGEVALDALMPIAPGLEDDWKYYVPQPIPDDAIEKAPRSITDVKLLDPACGSGHFLVIAFGLLARMYEEEARHRGEEWSASEIAERIVAQNLHGIDIDARAIQIAAAALWLRAKLYASSSRTELRLSRMNLVAPRFGLASLPKTDPARVTLEMELAQLGIPRATTAGLVEALKGVDHLGTLLRVDRAITELLDDADHDAGELFAHGAGLHRTRLEQSVASFLDAHASASDLGLRLGGEQFAAGMRFLEFTREGCYDIVVGNPPYQGLSKVSGFDYVVDAYPRGKADLYSAFIERGTQLCRLGGVNAIVTMQGWLSLAQFTELRRWLLHENCVRSVADLMWCAFENMRHATVAMVVIVKGRCASTAGVAVMPSSRTEREESMPALHRKRAALLAHVGRFEFESERFKAIKGEPIVYWWSVGFIDDYTRSPKVSERAVVREGLGTRNDARYVRAVWEVPREGICRTEFESTCTGHPSRWVPFVKGAQGRAWFEPLLDVVNWSRNGLELAANVKSKFGRGADYYYKRGIAYSTIGAEFKARAHSVASIFSDAGSSLFCSGADFANMLCALNSARGRFVLASLNPTVNFTNDDVQRVPILDVDGATEIVARLELAFAEHERHREPGVDFVAPGSSSWRYAQAWAQAAVDRGAGTPLPYFEPIEEVPATEAGISFAMGVTLGRFASRNEDSDCRSVMSLGSLAALTVGPDDRYGDSLAQYSSNPLHAAWDSYSPPLGKKTTLREYLRKDFFNYHEALYDGRPIYFPISSEKRSFVCWLSVHGFTDVTLAMLIADHLLPILRQLDAEISDAAAARGSADKKAAMAAGKAYDTAKKLRDELADFIALVSQCAERGAPPTDPGCPAREVDAPFSMDLDDGVMINSAALWPLLAPQWSDPKKWWKQLCLAEGKKDYDWAHLSKRYFPTRVDAKCRIDPSLAVAHGCFWKYHPAKAYQWELRLQDEIRPDFTIDEDGSDDLRAAYLALHASDAEAARDKERVRRERKAAKQEADADEGEPAEDTDSAEDNDA